MRLHKSITVVRLLEAVERASVTLDDPGFCIACGEDAEGVEPDARGYTCRTHAEPMPFTAPRGSVRARAKLV